MLRFIYKHLFILHAYEGVTSSTVVELVYFPHIGLQGKMGILAPFHRQGTWSLPELQQDVWGKAQHDCSPASRIGTKA